MCFASACYVHGNFLLNWTCFLLSLKYSNFFECFVSSFSGHWSIHCCCCFCSCRQLARPKTKCFRMKFPFLQLVGSAWKWKISSTRTAPKWRTVRSSDFRHRTVRNRKARGSNWNRWTPINGRQEATFNWVSCRSRCCCHILLFIYFAAVFVSVWLCNMAKCFVLKNVNQA